MFLSDGTEFSGAKLIQDVFEDREDIFVQIKKVKMQTTNIQ
jgi:hypothetical protein